MFGLCEQTMRENPEQLNLLILKPVCSALYGLLTLLSASLSVGHSNRFIYLFFMDDKMKNWRSQMTF